MTTVSVLARSCGYFFDRLIRYAREGVEAIQPKGGEDPLPAEGKCSPILGTDYSGMPYVTLER